MARFLKMAGLTLVAVAVVIALGAISPASAREAQTERAQFGARMAMASHGGFGRGLCGEAGLEAAAQALGMTADELSTQLWGGATLSSLADEAGVELQTVRDAVTAACQQATRDAIEQAVEDGSLTREHADWLLEGLDNGYWGGGAGPGWGGFHGRGGFFGRGGFRGFGPPGGNDVSPNTNDS
jgi:hypothetical protein